LPGQREDAAVLCDEQEAAQALGGLGSVEGLAERFGYLAGVVSAGCDRVQVSGGAAWRDRDAVLVGAPREQVGSYSPPAGDYARLAEKRIS
jgi:hypothetical protein